MAGNQDYAFSGLSQFGRIRPDEHISAHNRPLAKDTPRKTRSGVPWKPLESLAKPPSKQLHYRVVDGVKIAMPPYKDEHVLVSELRTINAPQADLLDHRARKRDHTCPARFARDVHTAEMEVSDAHVSWRQGRRIHAHENCPGHEEN